jgi:SAM-dependent methyltransferase
LAAEDRRRHWEQQYAAREYDSNRFDDWISAYIDRLPHGAPILEIGSGEGFISEVLHGHGYDVLATDVVAMPLDQLKERAPDIDTMVLDFENPLPFSSEAFAAVVADLCLHYFDSRTTTRILSEIARVLQGDGIILARVNSSDDIHYGAGLGRQVEPGFYEYKGHFKRFFDRRMILDFFAEWNVVEIRPSLLVHWEKPKSVFEVMARRPGPPGRASVELRRVANRCPRASVGRLRPTDR